MYNKKKELIPTGSCLILITPDSERTMCTYLGTAGKINDQDIDESIIKNSEITFLEGYLWDEGEPKKAFDKAITYSNKVAMSLSDLFCVERHKKHFLELAKNKLDIIFANEQEITSLIDAHSFKEIVTFSKQIKKNVVITRGDKGALSILNNELIECEAQKNLNIKDLTGAGDLFAAGYLHGIINNLSIKALFLFWSNKSPNSYAFIFSSLNSFNDESKNIFVTCYNEESQKGGLFLLKNDLLWCVFYLSSFVNNFLQETP